MSEVYKNNISGVKRILTIENKQGHLKYFWSCCELKSNNINHTCFKREGYFTCFCPKHSFRTHWHSLFWTETCCNIYDNLPGTDGREVKIQIRFWDFKGIEKWSGYDLVGLFEELKKQNVLWVYYNFLTFNRLVQHVCCIVVQAMEELIVE